MKYTAVVLSVADVKAARGFYEDQRILDLRALPPAGV